MIHSYGIHTWYTLHRFRRGFCPNGNNMRCSCFALKYHYLSGTENRWFHSGCGQLVLYPYKEAVHAFRLTRKQLYLQTLLLESYFPYPRMESFSQLRGVRLPVLQMQGEENIPSSSFSPNRHLVLSRGALFP